jgi:hypothetical protein
VNVDLQLVQLRLARGNFHVVDMGYAPAILHMFANVVMGGWALIVPYVSAHRVQHGLVHQPLLILHMIYKNALTLVYVNVQKANAFVASGGMVLHANTNHAQDRQHAPAMDNV